jgi:hypothetical protein
MHASVHACTHHGAGALAVRGRGIGVAVGRTSVVCGVDRVAVGAAAGVGVDQTGIVEAAVVNRHDVILAVLDVGGAVWVQGERTSRGRK